MEGFWRLLPAVRRVERHRFGFFFGVAALISLAQTLGLAGTEAMFLSRAGAAGLPAVFLLASAATVVGMLFYAGAVGVVRNDTLFVHLLWPLGVVLCAAAFSSALGVAAVLPALFVLHFVAQAVFVNHFWTFASDYFDILASKRLFPLFGFASSVGGIAGGALAVATARFAQPELLLAGWGAGLVAAALWIWAGRRDLMRFGLVELVERDETSLEALAGAARFLRRSALSRWLVASAFAMTLALLLSQYLYSSIFAERFPSAAELAGFFGVYLAASNLGEVLLGWKITPWLIRRLGVNGANLVHPVLTLLSFGGLAVEGRLAAAMAARMNREMFEDSVSATVRSLGYNAIAQRFRGRVRALVEGIVVHASIALVGAALLLWSDLDRRWLCAAGGATALAYLFTNLRIRRAYLATLVGGLRDGRLDLAQFRERLARWPAAQLVDLWQGVTAESGSHAVRSAEQLAPVLAARALREPLIEGAAHPEPGVRRACFEALAATATPVPEELLALGMRDPHPAVRRAVVHALVAQERGPAPAPATRGAGARPGAAVEVRRSRAARLAELMRDDDAEVRAETALALGSDGRAALAEMTRSAEPATAVAALRRLPRELSELAMQRSEDPDPTVRAAALEAVARSGGSVAVGHQRLSRDLRHADARVRSAAVSALAASAEAGTTSLDIIASALCDASRDVRLRAVAALRELGEAAAQAVLPHLRSDSPGTAESAVAVLAEHGFARRALVDELRRRVQLAWGDRLALRVLPPTDDLATRFLRAAHTDSTRRNQQVSFAILRAIEDPAVVRGIERALRLGSPRTRAQALEVLSNLGDREAAARLVVILEQRALEGRARADADTAEAAPGLDGAVDADRRALDVWIRLGTDFYRKRGDADVSQRETMERLLLLREVPLFSGLSLEQLDAINQIMTENHYLRDEMVFREGDPAGELYLLIEGRARVVADYGGADEHVLNQLEAPAYFGEMAILDDQPRSASVVVSEDARVLSLDGESFKELILHTPEIAFEVCRVLSSRIRALESGSPQT